MQMALPRFFGARACAREVAYVEHGAKVAACLLEVGELLHRVGDNKEVFLGSFGLLAGLHALVDGVNADLQVPGCRLEHLLAQVVSGNFVADHQDGVAGLLGGPAGHGLAMDHTIVDACERNGHTPLLSFRETCGKTTRLEEILLFLWAVFLGKFRTTDAARPR